MYVLINGAFGVGKTTVARELQALIPRAAILDPEWLGLLLQRLPGYRSSDFQHLGSWRRLTVSIARSIGIFRSPVIVPMAFSEPTYLHEVRSGLAASGRPVLHFCLTASLEVIRERLAARGEPVCDPKWSWVHRRALECCAAHQAPIFSVHLPTEGRSPATIAADLARRIHSGAS
jgi:predicted kinase